MYQLMYVLYVSVCNYTYTHIRMHTHWCVAAGVERVILYFPEGFLKPPEDFNFKAWPHESAVA